MVHITVYLYAKRNDPIQRKAWIVPKSWSLNSRRDKKPVKEREGKVRNDIRRY